METRQGMTVRQAAFIGVGAMVGAGIFALLGPAGAVAGAAVWLSFLIAGAVAGLQGYSFGKLGARYPSGSGLIEYLTRGFGDGHVTGTAAWMAFLSNMIVTAMVAVSFGDYATAMFTGGDRAWAKFFSAAIVVVMATLNVVGVAAVNKAQGLIVRVVVGILALFSLVTLFSADWTLLAPSGYPSMEAVFSSVALTFFAFLGFGVITFTAKDLREPRRELPRAIYIALGIATVVYVAISLGVFGTLSVDEVIASGGTAIAEAAKPTLGDAGYVLMGITALFATAGATNSGIYPAIGLSRDLASKGQFPPALGRDLGKVPAGLAISVLVSLVMALFLDMTAIASIGSAVALIVFTMVTFGHVRVRAETGARLWVLLVALGATVATLIAFAATTLADEPVTVVAVVVLVLLSIAIDFAWQKRRPRAGDLVASSAER